LKALAVFAKAPVLGTAKTRLQPLLGETGALQAHLTLVEFTLSAVMGSAVQRSLWISESHEVAEHWATRADAELRVQQGADLGARMSHTVESLFAEGASRVCIIGSDCATMTSAYIDKAMEELATHDAVFGPAKDGGYVLVGMSKPCTQLFTGIDWGTEHVLRQTLDGAAQMNLTVGLLEEAWDVDTPEEWLAFNALRTEK